MTKNIYNKKMLKQKLIT